MRISGNQISFGGSDMHFVEKFGIDGATSMVEDYMAFNRTPFIYDIYQLSEFLGYPLKTVMKVFRRHNIMYRGFVIPKKKNGIRKINAPETDLAFMQRRIKTGILDLFSVSPYAKAYRRNTSVYDNAKIHEGKKYLLKIDIEDFFGSIDEEMILTTVFNKSRYPAFVGVILTALCTKDGCLPQGACTSPAISNIVMKHFDDEMGKWCEGRGITYSRYSDDITFSSDKPLHTCYAKAKSFLENSGFSLNDRKTVFAGAGSLHRVTGLSVNIKTAVPKEYRRKLRQELYYAGKFGVEETVLWNGFKDFIREGKVEKKKYLNSLAGRIGWLRQIDPGSRETERLYTELIKIYEKEVN